MISLKRRTVVQHLIIAVGRKEPITSPNNPHSLRGSGERNNSFWVVVPSVAYLRTKGKGGHIFAR